MSDKCDKDIEEYNKCQFGIPFETALFQNRVFLKPTFF